MIIYNNFAFKEACSSSSVTKYLKIDGVDSFIFVSQKKINKSSTSVYIINVFK